MISKVSGAVSPRWLVVLAWITAWLVGLVALNWPGHYSFDSLVQLYEGVTGQSLPIIAAPPVMSGLLGLLVDLTSNPGSFVALNGAMLGASLVFLLRAWMPLTWTTVATLVVLTLSPILVVYTGIIWKDVLFANLALLGFAIVMAWGRSSWSLWRIVFAVALWTVAAFVRQNGFIVLLVGVLSMLWLAQRAADSSRLLRVRRSVLVAVGAGLTVGFLTGSVLAARIQTPADYDHASAGLRLVATFDVAGIVARDRDTPLDEFAAAGVDTESYREDVFRYYTPDRAAFLGQGTPVVVSTDVLISQWLHSIWNSPLSYVRHRASSFARLLGLSSPEACLPFHVGVDPPYPGLDDSIEIPDPPGSTQMLYGFAGAFTQTLFRPIVWLTLCMLAVLLEVRWRRRWSMELAMYVSAILFVGAYIAIGIECDVRFSYFAILVGHIAVLQIASRVRWSEPDTAEPMRLGRA